MTAANGIYPTILQLEREARHALNEDALRFVLVNRTHQLLPYRQAVLVRMDGPGRYAVEAVSNVPVIDPEAPLMQWLSRVLTTWSPDQDKAAAGQPSGVRLDAAVLPEALRAEWNTWWPPEALWQPLVAPGGAMLGGLILLRDHPFSTAELVLLDRLGDAYAHAWRGLRPPSGSLRTAVRRHGRRRVLWTAAAAVLLVLAFPVRQSALAPAEVVPRDPWLVAAPLEGVIEAMLVEPNQLVTQGAPLFRFEDAPLRARRDVAARQLAVAEAELRQAQQAAFRDDTHKGEVAVKLAAVALRQSELSYADELLARGVVRAPAAGIAVFADADQWVGRPVGVGERVMVVADPAHTELRAWLPVSDAIGLEVGSEVRLFLAVDPLNPVAAILRRTSYDAELTPEGVLSYRLQAAFREDKAVPRLGLQGTAKLYGTYAPFAFTLLRRPIATVRQMVGL